MSSLDIQSEDDRYLLSFLNRTFFRGFEENRENWNVVEYFLGKTCNLDCKYCYLAKYGRELYPQKEKREIIIENSKKLTDFLASFGFRGRIEIFSGEPLIKDYTFKILDYILENTDAKVVIPTNMTFIFNDELLDKVEDVLKSRRVFLSASVDGKYLQNENRPHKHGLKFGDDEWDEIFSFAKKWNIGFHPMIYSNGIEKWKDNFLWFMEMFRRFKIDPFAGLYLLEVRNPEWTCQQSLELKRFMEFLTKYTFHNLANSNPKTLKKIIFDLKGFNILSSPFTTIGRGIGCSLQSTLTVRIADLAIVPCHRTAYKQFIGGYFLADDDKIYGVKAHNPYTYSAMMTFSQSSSPYCERCILNGICTGGCLGAQYEFFGDPFVPIPSVCMLEYAKYLGIFKGFDEARVLGCILENVNQSKKTRIINFLEVMENGGK